MNHAETLKTIKIDSSYPSNTINNHVNSKSNVNNNKYIGQQRGFNDLYSNQNNTKIICSSPKRQKLNDSQYQHNNVVYNHNKNTNLSNNNMNAINLLSNIYRSFQYNNNNAFTNSQKHFTNPTNGNNNHDEIPALDPISVSPKIEPKSEQKTSLSLPPLNHPEKYETHERHEEHTSLRSDISALIYNNNNNNDYSYFPEFCNVRRLIHVQPIPSTQIIDNNEENTIIFVPISEIESASCHQCKTKKDVKILFYCTKSKPKKHVAYKTKLVKCKKKYCTSCMSKYFNESDVDKFKKYKDSISWSFDCPSCQDVCTCGACKRRRAKNKEAKFN